MVGENQTIISITQPGTYLAAVEIGDILYLSDPPVNVVRNNVKTTLTQSPSQTSKFQVATDIASPEPVSLSVQSTIFINPSIVQTQQN